MENSVCFEKVGKAKRLGSMLRVDFRRTFRFRTFYLVILAAFLVPLAMTVMMSMMDGKVSVNPQTGVESVTEGPENTWQNLGTLPGGEEMRGAEIFALCNVNMVFLGVAVFVGLFMTEDFKSGYAKNLFTFRVGRGDYIFSKIVVGAVCGALMFAAYFLGTVLGGAIAGLSFDLCGLTVGNLIFCMLSKVFLGAVFVSVFVTVGAAAKQKTWLALCGSLGCGALLFMTASIAAPLSATPIHVVLCLAAGLLAAWGLGFVGKKILQKTSMV